MEVFGKRATSVDKQQPQSIESCRIVSSIHNIITYIRLAHYEYRLFIVLRRGRIEINIRPLID